MMPAQHCGGGTAGGEGTTCSRQVRTSLRQRGGAKSAGVSTGKGGGKTAPLVIQSVETPWHFWAWMPLSHFQPWLSAAGKAESMPEGELQQLGRFASSDLDSCWQQEGGSSLLVSSSAAART
jgi:hypothetical protein